MIWESYTKETSSLKKKIIIYFINSTIEVKYEGIHFWRFIFKCPN